MSSSHLTLSDARMRAHREAIGALERGVAVDVVIPKVQRDVLAPLLDVALDTFNEAFRQAKAARDTAMRDAWLAYGDVVAKLGRDDG